MIGFIKINVRVENRTMTNKERNICLLNALICGNMEDGCNIAVLRASESDVSEVSTVSVKNCLIFWNIP
jgi:hypothetical protein